MAIVASESDIGRRVIYLDGSLGTLSRINHHMAFVVWDRRTSSGNMLPGEVESGTAFDELEWAS